MNTTQLERLLFNLIDSDKCTALGVFASDNVPKVISRFPSCFISNTDPAKHSGQHWVAYYFTSPSTYEFFDSYAFEPRCYMLYYDSPIILNNRPLQSLKSNVCGQYCLYFLESRSRGISFTSIINSFSHSPKFNDKLVANFVNRILNPKKLFKSFNALQSCNSFNVMNNKLKH